ncbi:MAG: NAD(P)H-dependent oxidoreductase [Gammaproteobacteria bacterium]|nr:NAD(P)H-dependent oxidoreductase [Gammaproteobacteria bacterium]MCP4090541.1 NAD(P)H-dependent oxidoreductase [Gammaproteobacteria bacterium]MCP4276594.1 NAD(P)H-dependent oxidoreductase [Gammaproteobacteria bacterium]MCP4831340.1 NAD(P)H-dependent oxidoreductase [Gammaproteobacteria bacterium]MCP4928728.1 NAD(P)H-dependent oxidoreductase [Gammaproteobacteria bacterium]
MKILAIVGTPTKHDGYTTKTVEVLEQRFLKQRDAEFSYLFLEDHNLPGCQGRLSCIKFGEHKCPFEPKVTPIVRAMENADVVIFASPVHCFNVSTLMKNFIDLLVYQMHRPAFFGKKALIVATAAGAGQKGILKYLHKTVANWGFDVVGQLGTHSGFFDKEKYFNKLTKAADKLATKTITAVDKDVTPKPGLAELINFRVWRSTVAINEQNSPYDWEHWKKSGWLDQDYYFETKGNFISKSIAFLIEKLIAQAIRNVSVGPST